MVGAAWSRSVALLTAASLPETCIAGGPLVHAVSEPTWSTRSLLVKKAYLYSSPPYLLMQAFETLDNAGKVFSLLEDVMEVALPRLAK